MIYLNGQPTAEFVPEIVDNLTTNDSTKALSAKQGKVLNEKTADDIPYSSGVSVKDKIDSDNTKTDVAVTSLVTGVTVDINKSCKIGKTFYLIVKGHYTGTLSNITCLGVDISSLSVTNYTFPIGLGQEWNINGIGYGYIDSNERITITASVTSGYFHICQALPLA